MDPLVLRAYAKVNLALEVLGRREDGYHEVATVLHTVSLWDDLTLSPASRLSVQCDAPGLEGRENLVWRAAERLQSYAGVHRGATVGVRKGIPVAAGLGGGSSDAAASLRALNRLWDLRLPGVRLLEVAAQVGSDVPYLLFGGAALATGRGERLTLLPPAPDRWLVLVDPGLQTPRKTATLYGRLQAEHFTRGRSAETLADALRARAPWPEQHMMNAFEAVADGVFPGLARQRRTMEEAGAGAVHLSGSGPSLFALVEGEKAGQRLADAMRERGLEARLVRTVAPEGW